jgi:hypothetical protein
MLKGTIKEENGKYEEAQRRKVRGLEWKRNLDWNDWIFGRRLKMSDWQSGVQLWLQFHKDGWFVSSSRDVVVC